MTSIRSPQWLTMASVVLAAALAAAQEPAATIRVAIYPFDDSSVRPVVRQLTEMDMPYGQVAADYAMSYLQGQRIEVITRDQIKVLLEEQNRKFSERFDASQAVELGRLLSVDAIIGGKITNLNLSTSERPDGKVGFIFGRSVSEVLGVADVSVQLIATSTGSTLASPIRRGERTWRTGTTMKTTDEKTKREKIEQTRKSQANNDLYLRETLRVAVEDVSRVVLDAAARIPASALRRAAPPPQRPTQPAAAPPAGADRPAIIPPAAAADIRYIALDDEIGVVVKVASGALTFSRTEAVEVHVGDLLEVHHPEPVFNPRTGKTFLVGEKVATLEVTEVRPDYCRAKVTGDVKLDDRVIAVKAAAPLKRAARRAPGVS